MHSYECKLRAIFREWREGKIGDGDFDRKAEIYHREEFKRRYELVGMEQHMIAPFEGEMEEDEFAGELGEVLREALLKDCPQDQLPPEPAMRLVLERTKGMGGYNAHEIRLLGQPGHPASLEFTWDVIATVRKRVLEEELKRAVTEEEGKLLVSFERTNQRLMEKLAIKGTGSFEYPVTPRMAEAYWAAQASEEKKWGEEYQKMTEGKATQYLSFRGKGRVAARVALPEVHPASEEELEVAKIRKQIYEEREKEKKAKEAEKGEAEIVTKTKNLQVNEA